MNCSIKIPSHIYDDERVKGKRLNTLQSSATLFTKTKNEMSRENTFDGFGMYPFSESRVRFLVRAFSISFFIYKNVCRLLSASHRVISPCSHMIGLDLEAACHELRDWPNS